MTFGADRYILEEHWAVTLFPVFLVTLSVSPTSKYEAVSTCVGKLFFTTHVVDRLKLQGINGALGHSP